MSRFVISSTGGRSSDEQRFLEKHQYILDQLDIDDAREATRRGVVRGISLYRSVPSVFKWLILVGGVFTVVVLLPFFLVAVSQTLTNFSSMHRLIHTLIVGTVGLGGLILMYAILVFF